MILTKKDIRRIIKETEEQDIRQTARIICPELLAKYDEALYWEAYMESEHGDAGDRD